MNTYITKTAFPLYNLLNIHSNEPYVLISCLSSREFRDVEERFNMFKSGSSSRNMIEHLTLQFHDCEPNKTVDGVPVKFGNLEFFSEEHAHKILTLHEKMIDTGINRLYVHCWDGVSRSPAVCAALDNIEGKPDDHWFKNYSPNPYVYRTLIETYYKIVS